MPTWEYTNPYPGDVYLGPRRWWSATAILCALHLVMSGAAALLTSPFGYDAAGWLLLDLNALYEFRLWQLLTYAFVHPFTYAMAAFWLIFAVYMLWVFGRAIEEAAGTRRFLTVYFAAQLYGGLAHLIYASVYSDVPASGIFMAPILGVLFYCSLLWPQRSILFFFIIPMSFRLAALLSLGLTVFFCIIRFRQGDAPFVTLGAVAAVYLVYKLDPLIDGWLERWESRRVRRRAMEEFELRKRVDAILDKISVEGMGSLSREERTLLKRASRLLQDQRNRND